MARVQKICIPDVKWLRPISRVETLELIELTFNDRENRWSEADRTEFCREAGVFCEWRKSPTACLTRILKRLEFYRMILFEN